MTPEGKVTESIRRYLKKLKASGVPIFFAKIAGGPRQKSGLPDWHITYRGRSLWVEVKAPGKKATPLQQGVIDEIAAAGGEAFVATDVTEVQAILQRIRHDSESEWSKE